MGSKLDQDPSSDLSFFHDSAKQRNGQTDKQMVMNIIPPWIFWINWRVECQSYASKF